MCVEITADALRMVRVVAGQISKRTQYPFDDAYGAGLIGLVEASHRWKDNMGATFLHFAEHRVRGAIYDEMRRMIPGSRSMQKQDKTPKLTSIERLVENTEDLDRVLVLADSTDVAEDVADRLMQEDAVRELNNLHPRHAYMVWASANGERLRDIGTVLGITEAGVSYSRKRALRLLRKRLDHWHSWDGVVT